MNPLVPALLALLGCAATAPEEPKEDPKPAPLPIPVREDPKPEPPKPEEPKPSPTPTPDPVPAPVVEEPKTPDPPPLPPPPPPPPKTSPEAKALLLEAAKRQGTEGLVGGLAPTRYRATFATVLVHSEGGSKAEFTNSNEAFALPVPGAKEARMRSDVVADGKRIVLGHNGRLGWMWTKDMETQEERVRRFTDREKDAEDIRDLDSRRRMLRLALRVFFLGEMGEAAVPVTSLGAETRSVPVGRDGKTRKIQCLVLERAADPKEGEPALRILLDADSKDPVAILLLPPKPGEPSFLLTLDFDPPKDRDRKQFPKGVRVPDWLELFEIPAAAEEPPALRIQAAISVFEIDPAKVPDALFEVPR